MAKYVSDRERYDALFDEVLQFLKTDQDEMLVELLSDCHTADIAEIITDLQGDERLHLFSLLTDEQSAEVFSELDVDDFIELFSILTRKQKQSILNIMPNDDIVDIIGEMPDELKDRMLKLLDSEDAEDVSELLVYDEDTAGGIMTSEYVDLNMNMQVADAIDFLRNNAPDAETVYYVYVVDEKGVLVGIISLRQLLVTKGDTLIKDIMNENVISARVDDDQEEAARIVSKYSFLALPVIDSEEKLVGIITVDDIIDILEEEATEDMLKFAGTSDEELEANERNVLFSIYKSVKSRLPWLIITIFGGMLSAYVVSSFENVLSADATIALFMPLLAGMGGNVGTQSSTITVRTIALNDVRGRETLRLILHEVFVGLFVGLICASIVALISYFMKSRIVFSLIVGLSMFANIFTAAIIGTTVPLVFKKVGVDPAVASAPFITTTIDITGLTIYFTLATVLMLHLT